MAAPRKRWGATRRKSQGCELPQASVLGNLLPTILFTNHIRSPSVHPQPMRLIWPSSFLRSFDGVYDDPPNSNFKFGAYSGLLSVLFRPRDGFKIYPNHRHVTAPRESPDCIMMLDLKFKDKPLLMVRVKPPEHIHSPSAREAADKHIQSRINDLSGLLRPPRPLLSGINRTRLIAECPLPVFYAVCTMGNRFCFYSKPRDGPIRSPQIPAKAKKGSSNMVPQEYWRYDILDGEGQQKFQEVVTEIKQACVAL